MSTFIDFRMRFYYRFGPSNGGWVDTYGSRHLDRYAEQLWLTLFDFGQLQGQIRDADRAPWQGQGTSFGLDATIQSVTPSNGTTVKSPTFARAAGYALEQVDEFIGKLGTPVGLKSYKPYHSTG